MLRRNRIFSYCSHPFEKFYDVDVTFVNDIVHVLCQWELNTLPNPSVHPTLLPLIVKSNLPFPLPNMAE